MAVDGYRGYDDDDAGLDAYEDTGSGIAGKTFLWLAWAAAAVFWGFMLTTGAGILKAADNPALARPAGEADIGGLGFFAMDVLGGLVILGLAIAFGMWRYSTRDKSMDPITEAATAATYQMVDAAGGDDDIHRGPGEHRTEERDAYRAINNPRMH
jgi:hypothetical protein